MLQKELSNESKTEDKSKLKQVKIDFIRQCGNQRTPDKNKELNGKSTLGTDELKVEIPIEFVQKTGSSNNTLVPKEGKDLDTFDYWFKKEYKSATGAGS